MFNCRYPINRPGVVADTCDREYEVLVNDKFEKFNLFETPLHGVLNKSVRGLHFDRMLTISFDQFKEIYLTDKKKAESGFPVIIIGSHRFSMQTRPGDIYVCVSPLGSFFAHSDFVDIVSNV